MSAQPIEPPPPTPITSAREARLAVESMLDSLPELPAPTMVVRPGIVHVTVASVEDLGAWLYALGGEVRRGIPLDDVSVWTLRTETPQRGDGSTVAIRVHCPVVAGEIVPTAFRPAVVL